MDGNADEDGDCTMNGSSNQAAEVCDTSSSTSPSVQQHKKHKGDLASHSLLAPNKQEAADMMVAFEESEYIQSTEQDYQELSPDM